MPAKPKPILDPDVVKSLLYIVRGQRVMLDSDLAKLYGIATRELNQAVKRNKERFPIDFAYLLTTQELTILRSQFVISSSGFGGRRYRPMVFTEHGVAMLSSVLRSPTAVKVNIEIMRAFVRVRRLLATPGDLVTQLQQLAETVKFHDEQILAISDVLRKMLEPPPPPGNNPRRIGFLPKKENTP